MNGRSHCIWPLIVSSLLVLTAYPAESSRERTTSDESPRIGNSRPRTDYGVSSAFNQQYWESASAISHFVELKGRVTDSANEAVRGAIVLLLSARESTNHIFSPTARFPRLPRYVHTDSNGGFVFERIDPDWNYYVRVVAPKFEEYTAEALNASSGAINIRLTSGKRDDRNHQKMLKGRVVDASGRPISRALIRILGVTRNRTMQWPASDIQFYAASDDEGYFTVRATARFEAAEGAAEAAGYLTGLFEGWKPGDEVHTVTLNTGAVLRGRILSEDAPVEGVEVRCGRFGRESGSHVWSYSVLTDAEGRFRFEHLPPNRYGFLYATMESLTGRGALPERWLKLGGEGSTNELHDLQLEPAFPVSGKIQLSDGKRIPANSQILLYRSNQRASMDVTVAGVAANGAFRFENVPAEEVQLQFRIPGYQFSPQDQRMMAGSSTNLAVGPGMFPLEFQMHPR